MNKKHVAYALAWMLGITGVCGGDIAPATFAPANVRTVEAADTAAVTTTTIDSNFATDLKWITEGDQRGGISFQLNVPVASNQVIHEKIFRVGEDHHIQWRTIIRSREGVRPQRIINTDSTLDINDEGQYYYQVGISGEERDSEITWSANSEIFNYKAGTRLPTPERPMFSSEKQNVLTWKYNTDNLYGFWVRIRQYNSNGDRTGNDRKLFVSRDEWEKGDDAQGVDLTQYLENLDQFSYEAKVRALSNHFSVIENSEYSVYSNMIGNSTYNPQAAEMKQAIEEAAEKGDKSIITSKYDTKDKKKELAKVIQTSEQAQNDIRKLEQKYMEANGITVKDTVSGDPRIDASGIEMLGAGLVGDSQYNKIGLEVKPQTEDMSKYTNSKFTNVYAFQMNLTKSDGTTTTEVTELDVPITIILPKPAGLKYGDLRILHYLTGQTDPEIIEPILLGDKIKFTIYHFSTFAFADAQGGSSTPSSGSTSSSGSVSSTGSIYSSSSSSSGGGGGSGKPSYTKGKGASKAMYSKGGKGTVRYEMSASKLSTKSVKIPATVKIGKKTYKVTAVSPQAFIGYDKMTSVVIGKNVKSIGSGAFAGCKSLKTITVNTKKLTKKTTKNCLKDSAVKTVKAPKGKVKAYKKVFAKSNSGSKSSVKVK